jgi:hypothetical protein
LSLSYQKYGFGIWGIRDPGSGKTYSVSRVKKGTGSRIPDPQHCKKNLRIRIHNNTGFFLARLTCAVCRKVFKEARALRYHQIHHPQLLATPPAQQQQQHSVSATTPDMMNGFAGSFLNGCDYELDNKSGMISRKTNAQCGSGMLILDPNFSIPDPGSKRNRIPDLDPQQIILTIFNPNNCYRY